MSEITEILASPLKTVPRLKCVGEALGVLIDAIEGLAQTDKEGYDRGMKAISVISWFLCDCMRYQAKFIECKMEQLQDEVLSLEGRYATFLARAKEFGMNCAEEEQEIYDFDQAQYLRSVELAERQDEEREMMEAHADA